MCSMISRGGAQQETLETVFITYIWPNQCDCIFSIMFKAVAPR
jgi:hypothetical protein